MPVPPYLGQEITRTFGESRGPLHLEAYFPRLGFSILSVVCVDKEEENSLVVLYGENAPLAYDLCHGTSKKLRDVETFPYCQGEPFPLYAKW
ncbi:conserved hypothetical protein [Ricinus communis]|uniref:Uncharacterized protein n=1 Tax=Ricinus communis TaxID=3988 RepID=B9RWE8_RICCO|nr:conserved hypothetical protein [Ricinus communis]